MFRLPFSRWLAMIVWLATVKGADAQFVAFYDHARGTGTHQATLVFPANSSGANGLLTNVVNSVTTPVSITTAVSNNGAIVALGSSAGYPTAGTPAYNTFDSYVDFVGTPGAAIQIPSNCFVVFTFSNLNPNARYSFKGSAVRGNIMYSNRWTKVTILETDSAAPNHTSNAVTSAQAPPDLGPNDAAFLFGQNHLPNQGDVAVWEDINPGPDGAFQIACTRYTGFVPNGTSHDVSGVASLYGYGISGIRLEEVIPEPVMITNGPTPASLAVEQGQTAQFTVAASGTWPRYEWYREDGQPITRALNTNSSTLTITNAQPADGGVYKVRVFNSISSVISDAVTLTVNQDTTPPTLVAALAWLNGTNILIAFSEPLDVSPLAAGAFHVHFTSGGGVLTVISAVVTNGTNVLISTDSPRVADRNYTVTVDANAVGDINGVAFAGGDVLLVVQVYLLSFEGTQWKYSAEGMDLSALWYLPEYDDATWSNGLSVFDGKTPQPPGRTTVGGLSVATQLPLTNSAYPSTNMVIPTYYFRTIFNLATTPEHVLSLKLRTLVDDFEDFFINAQEARRNPGYPSTNLPPQFGYSGGTAVGTASIQGPFDVPSDILRAGENIAAAIVNQVNGGSSDITFGYELVATIDRFTEPGVALSIGFDPNVPGNILITWPEPSAVLYWLSDLNSGTWTAIDTSATPGQYSFDPNAMEQRFFTLRH